MNTRCFSINAEDCKTLVSLGSGYSGSIMADIIRELNKQFDRPSAGSAVSALKSAVISKFQALEHMG